jgi:hypothetical protein
VHLTCTVAGGAGGKLRALFRTGTTTHGAGADFCKENTTLNPKNGVLKGELDVNRNVTSTPLALPSPTEETTEHVVEVELNTPLPKTVEV